MIYLPSREINTSHERIWLKLNGIDWMDIVPTMACCSAVHQHPGIYHWSVVVLFNSATYLFTSYCYRAVGLFANILSHLFSMSAGEEEEHGYEAIIKALLKALIDMKGSQMDSLKPPAFDWNSLEFFQILIKHMESQYKL